MISPKALALHYEVAMFIVVCVGEEGSSCRQVLLVFELSDKLGQLEVL